MEEKSSGKEQAIDGKPFAFRSQNTRALLEQLTRAFSQKFENPLIERSSQSIIREIEANLKVQHSLTRNLEDDLAVLHQPELAQSLASIRGFSQHTVQYLCSQIKSLAESNSNLLKNKLQNKQVGRTECQLCSRRLEEVRIDEVRQRLETSSSHWDESRSNISGLYRDQEIVEYQQSHSPPFYDAVLSEMVANRSNIKNINNDKTVNMLEDFLKNLFATDTALEFEPGDHNILNKYRNGKEIVGQLYDEFAFGLQKYAKKDVMPVVYRLSKEYFRLEEARRLKSRLHQSCQTVDYLAVDSKPLDLKHPQIRDKTDPLKKDSTLITETTEEMMARGIRVRNKLAIFSNSVDVHQSYTRARRHLSVELPKSDCVEMGCQTKIIGTDKTTQTPVPVNKQPLHKSMSVSQPMLSPGTSDDPTSSRHNLSSSKGMSQLMGVSGLLATDNTVLEEDENDERDGDIRSDELFLQANQFDQGVPPKPKLESLAEQDKQQLVKNLKGKQSNKTALKNTAALQKARYTVASGQGKEFAEVLGLKDLNLKQYHKNDSVLGGALDALSKLKVLKVRPSNDQLGDANTATKSKHRKNLSFNRDSRIAKIPENHVIQEEQENEQRQAKCMTDERSSVSYKEEPPTSEYASRLSRVLRKVSSYGGSMLFMKKVLETCDFMLQHEQSLRDVDVVSLLLPYCQEQRKHQSTLQQSVAKGQAVCLKETLTPAKVQPNLFREQACNGDILASKYLKETNKSLHLSSTRAQLKLPQLQQIHRSRTNDRMVGDSLEELAQFSRSDAARLRYPKTDSVSRVPGTNIYVRNDVQNQDLLANVFKSDDLLLFGGIAQAYEFESIGTKNSLSTPLVDLEKRTAISDMQLTDDNRRLICAVYQSLEELREKCRPRYQLIKSFLRYPYQTVCNDFSELDGNDHLSMPGFEESFGMILKLHRKCQESGLCRHIQTFLRKIGFPASSCC